MIDIQEFICPKIQKSFAQMDSFEFQQLIKTEIEILVYKYKQLVEKEKKEKAAKQLQEFYSDPFK